MFKKIVSMLIACVMIFTLSSSNLIQAAESNSLDARLRKMNVPEELIQNMTDVMKEDILKNTIKFVGYKKIEPVTTEGSGDITPMGTIPSSDLDFYASVYVSNNSPDGRERFTFYVNYQWLTMPTYTQKDPYGIAWDEDIWRGVPGSSYNIDMWHVKATDRWFSTPGTALAYTAAGGCGWNAVWPSYSLYGDLYSFEGFGKVTVEAKTVGPISGSSQIHVNYAHTYGLAGSIGLSFFGINVAYTGSRSADTQGDWANFDY